MTTRRSTHATAEQLDELRVLFHRLWTKAQGTPDYDKAEWLRLEALLAQVGVRL